MAYTRFYLKAYKDKYGDTKGAYKGKKPGELKQWRREQWIDVKSYIEDPKNPTACGNEPYNEKKEYPLCMPIQEAAKYSKGELGLLVKRKSELGSKRLVKDAYLRDVLRPDEIPKSRIYKQKYAKDKMERIPKPLPEAQAKKILKEKPVGITKMENEPAETVQKVEVPVVEKEKRPRGRPRLSDEQRETNKQASLQRRKEARQVVAEENRKRREETKRQKEEERAKARAEALLNKPPRQPREEKSRNLYNSVVIQRGSFPVRFD
jgi:hypothetical protein